ncbi:MAG: hypothetical protein CL583_04840 [Alteromonadaceae bacterium]|nr:hypothetical protein [Alteromonadaceae bacterium]
MDGVKVPHQPLNPYTQFSKPRYAGASVYLFSAVLDRFFAQFAQINTFTRLRIRLSGHSQDYHVWPARSGERELL